VIPLLSAAYNISVLPICELDLMQDSSVHSVMAMLIPYASLVTTFKSISSSGKSTNYWVEFIRLKMILSSNLKF
jgi:hypothetical protein